MEIGAGLATLLFVLVSSVLLFRSAIRNGLLSSLSSSTLLSQVSTGNVPLLHYGLPFGFTQKELEQLDLKGKVVIITGANIGLGLATAKALAQQGATVVLACRSVQKGDDAAREINGRQKKNGSLSHNRKVQPGPREDESEICGLGIDGNAVCMELDLCSLASVKKFAEAFNQKFERLDSLILNAGIVMPNQGLTADGIELQMGVNHIGHTLLVKLLLPKLIATESPNPRTIVFLSSASHTVASKNLILTTLDAAIHNSTVPSELYGRNIFYGNSKFCNIIAAKALSREVNNNQVLINALNPGVVKTHAARHVVLKIAHALHLPEWFVFHAYEVVVGWAMWPAEVAALSSLYLAIGPELLKSKRSGRFFCPIAREAEPFPLVFDVEFQQEIWHKTIKILKTKGFLA